LAGIAFGFARVKTGSTTGPAIVHAGYNTTLFAAFLIQHQL
jgi:membrane protease YdiL (CAAX protease family)